MQITKDKFDRACVQAELPPPQAAALWRFLEQAAPVPGSPAAAPSRFDLAHLAYYFGAVVVLGSMGWFMNETWENFGGKGIFAIAAIYAVVFAFAGREFRRRPDPDLHTPGGLLVTLAVGMVPLMVYGLERWVGWWPQDDPGSYTNFHPFVNGSWIVMELATILAGAVALWFVRFPFLTAPIAFALWYLSMDTTPLLFGRASWGHEERLWLSVWFGVAMLAVAYVVDVRRRWRGPDYGFWLSFFGLIAFWFGLTLMDSHGEWNRFVYAGINVVLMMGGVVLDRRAAVVWGACGVSAYLGHLAFDLFANSLLFPFALCAVGLFIMAAGVFYQRRHRAWRGAIVGKIPERYARLVPALHAARRGEPA